MRVPLYQVDAFTRRRFAGNPAAVVILDEFPEDGAMQAIAAENNLAETAFLVADGEDFRCAGSPRPSRYRSAGTPRWQVRRW